MVVAIFQPTLSGSTVVCDASSSPAQPGQELAIVLEGAPATHTRTVVLAYSLAGVQAIPITLGTAPNQADLSVSLEAYQPAPDGLHEVRTAPDASLLKGAKQPYAYEVTVTNQPRRPTPTCTSS